MSGWVEYSSTLTFSHHLNSITIVHWYSSMHVCNAWYNYLNHTILTAIRLRSNVLTVAVIVIILFIL